MFNSILRFGEDKRICAVSYLLPLILPSEHLSTGWVLLPIGPSLLFIIAMLAPKASQLKFHAIQSIFLSGVFFFAVVIIYLFILYGEGSGMNFITILIHLGMWALLVAMILLVFLILISILFFKTWRGKTLHLPLLSKWARAVSEGNFI